MKDMYTIPEFCKWAGIGRTHYYNLKKAGAGPAETILGKSVRITKREANEWIKRHTRPLVIHPPTPQISETVVIEKSKSHRREEKKSQTKTEISIGNYSKRAGKMRSLPSTLGGLMYTFREFCKFAKISLSHFQSIRQQGLTPDIIYLSPRCPRITHAAANEWLASRNSVVSLRYAANEEVLAPAWVSVIEALPTPESKVRYWVVIERKKDGIVNGHEVSTAFFIPKYRKRENGFHDAVKYWMSYREPSLPVGLLKLYTGGV